MTGGAARRVGSVAEVRAGRGRTRCAQRAQLRTDAHSADPSTRCSQLLRAGTWCPPRRPPRYGVYCSPRTQALPSAPRSVEAADLRAAQLEEALLSRDVIGQAEGMLMAQRRISAAQAFEVLRTASQYLNVKLAKIAETIATRQVEL